MKLQHYNYTVKDWPGIQHQNADALSRIDVDGFIRRIFQESQIREKMKIVQLEDPELIKEMETNERYVLIEGIWYWKQVGSEGKEQYKLVVPAKLRTSILEENHDSLMGSHLGIKRTYTRLTQDYYWPKMYKEVRI